MKTLMTLGLGALAMYLLDPQQGRRRRALLREQVRDLSNRAYGKVTEARGAGKSTLESDRPDMRPTDTPQSAQHLGR